MAAWRNGDGAPKRGHSSRRSYSSSPAMSYQPPSRSPSPRTNRLRRAQEERDVGRGRDTDYGRDDQRMARDRDRDRDRDQDRDRDRNRDREKNVDRVRSRDGDYGRDTRPSREEERPRDRRGRQREPEKRSRDRSRDREREAEGRSRDRSIERSRDRSRDRRGGRGERPEETSPMRSPVRSSRRDRSFSPRDVQPRRGRRSPSRSPPRHQTGSKHEQRTNNNSVTSAAAAARDEEEDGEDAAREGPRGEGSPQEDEGVLRMKEVEAALEQKEANKEQPSFEYSGKLAAETNKVKGVTLQFTEPPEARKPNTRWRLYVFKDGEPLNDPLYIHRQTCYLFGRERRVADIPTDHPSCSKQHAVIQYRLTEKVDANGMTSNKVRPYVMDLGSTNGTMLNGERLDPQRYYEMFEKDTIKFGNSSREYVLLHEHSIG